MKQILRTVLKVMLLLTLLALAVLLVFGLVLWIGWPWWVGFFVLIGLLGVGLGIILMRKIWVRRREQKFVHQIIEQDEANRQHLTVNEQDASKELQARWKEAIEALRHSHLRKYGNPLYVLPWYMVIGESGSGKTTAIQSARLSSPFAEVSRTSGISGTRNCDWWFFEQAILIDTAGRYAVPVDEGRDKDEWQKFLTLLAKFRKKEPLNGLVVTIAADQLAQNTPEALQEEGRSIRRRIEELTRVLGAKIPVYVLVTKCDLIQGATQFCESLPEEALNQAMGMLNRDLKADVPALTEKTYRSVGDRLRDLRLLLLNQIKKPSKAAAMLLFPEEFEKLREGLSAFIGGAFQENPYQETPLLRGLHFSSGRQEGTPFSHFLNALGLIQARQVLAGTNKGLFLHDFFAKILPNDRHLFKPTQHMQEWRQLTRNLGLTAWIAVVVAACGLLSYAFVKNLNALSDLRHEFQKPAVLQGDLLPDVITMDRFRQALVRAEEQNSHWWIPRMGLRESLNVEEELKTKYIRLFDRGFLNDFDKSMDQRMTRMGVQTPNPVFGAHVANLVRRINLLKARLSQEDLDQLALLPQPPFNPSLLGRSDIIAEIQNKLSTEYLYAVAWQDDSDRLNKELSYLQTWLKHLLTLPGVTLNWLTDWVNSDPSLSPVGLHDFWGGQEAEDELMVPAAFTQKGKTKIDAAIAEIESALFDPLIIAGPKIAFDKWYHQAYFAAWQDFTRNFAKGEKLLRTREQWQAVAKRLPSPQGPYNALIDRLADEFGHFGKEIQLPSWVDLTYDWQDLRIESQASKGVDLEKAGIIRKATSKVKSKILRAERSFGVKARAPLDAKAQLKATKAFVDYQTALDGTVKAAESRRVAFQMATDLYQQDPATGDSPFLAAYRAAGDIRSIVGDIQDEGQALFWDLLTDNIRFMHKYVNREAACYLQERWEKDVLLEVQDVSAEKDMAQLMMGPSGFATGFLKGPAAPFITRSLGKGYYPRESMELALPFQKDFLAYLTKGAQAAHPTRSSYRVKIRAYPTDTNREAQLRPHSTVLELQCADGNTRLENLNYPVAKTFNWSPQSCGDVLFQISVGNLVLTTNYTGHYAFAKFLNDFKTGQRIFKRDEFPSEEAALRRIGIRYIKAKYQFQGQNAVLALLYAAPGKPPRKIVTCWDQ